MSMIIYSISLSLFDSLSSAQQIVIFVLLFTTARPLRNALSYLAGLCGAYFICGTAGYLALDKLHIFLSKYFPSSATMSNPLYYQAEFLMGFIMVVLGVWYFRRKKRARQGWVGNMILSKLRTMNSLFAFCIGIFIAVTQFMGSFLYLVALDKYATVHLGAVAAAGYILLYNIGYVLPMVVILFVYLIARGYAADQNDTLNEKAERLKIHLITWTLVVFGIFSMLDAGCYFATGHALIKGRYF